jgi:uncharacterized membrane protein YbhN (UPF0104 family)
VNDGLERSVAPAKGELARKIVTGIVVVAVVASVASALSGYRQALTGRIADLEFGWLAVGLAFSIVYRVVNAYGWVLVLRSLGQRLPAAEGIRLWLISETMRWLPGSVWSFFSRAAQAKSRGIPAVTASLSLLLELLLTIAAWTVTAAVGVGLSGVGSVWLRRMSPLWLALSVVALALTVALPLLVARWRPSARLTKKLKGLGEGLRQLEQSRPRLSWLAIAFSLFVVLCAFNGVAFLAILRAVSDSPPGLSAAIGINATGWLVGFFAFFAPAGLGVREGGMTAMLAPLLPVDAAVVGVLLWRLIQIVVELVCLAGCFAASAAPGLRRLVRNTWAETR